MRFWRAVGVVLLLAIVIGGFAIYRVKRPYRGFSGTIYVELPRGTSTNGIAVELAKAGVIGSRWDFWLARWPIGDAPCKPENTLSTVRRRPWKW
jgi:cell division protein YceG involved in septum cleavage